MTLRRGQRFEMNGVKWRVAYVNASRAHCIATVREPVTVRDRRRDCDRTYAATRRLSIDISPNAGVELLGALEQAVPQ